MLAVRLACLLYQQSIVTQEIIEGCHRSQVKIDYNCALLGERHSGDTRIDYTLLKVVR